MEIVFVEDHKPNEAIFDSPFLFDFEEIGGINDIYRKGEFEYKYSKRNILEKGEIQDQINKKPNWENNLTLRSTWTKSKFYDTNGFGSKSYDFKDFDVLDPTIDPSVQPDDDPCNEMDCKVDSFPKSWHYINLDNMMPTIIHVITNQSIFIGVMTYQPYDRGKTWNWLQTKKIYLCQVKKHKVVITSLYCNYHQLQIKMNTIKSQLMKGSKLQYTMFSSQNCLRHQVLSALKHMFRNHETKYTYIEVSPMVHVLSRGEYYGYNYISVVTSNLTKLGTTANRTILSLVSA
jgi:hypothetical protein